LPEPSDLNFQAQDDWVNTICFLWYRK
jgi:hypothetical protein